jgi:CRP-like cAMP-binding protein
MDESNAKTVDDLIAALRLAPSERTAQDVDTIIAIVSKWPDFAGFVHTEQMRREVCRQMNLEEHKPNTVLFKVNDEPDGWYIVVSGKCDIVIGWGDDSFFAAMPPIQLQILKKALGNNAKFRVIAAKGPKQEFGSAALINNKKRNATIYISEPTLLIRVDAQHYKDTAQFFQEHVFRKKQNFFQRSQSFSHSKIIKIFLQELLKIQLIVQSK